MLQAFVAKIAHGPTLICTYIPLGPVNFCPRPNTSLQHLTHLIVGFNADVIYGLGLLTDLLSSLLHIAHK